jgi:predicted exporter
MMTTLLHKVRARWALAIFAVLGLAWLAQLDFSQKISTDVLDLIPTGEREPELAMVRSLANEQQARVALFALSWPEGVDPALRQQAADRFGASLRASTTIAELVPLAEESAVKETLGRYTYEHRFELLLPDWLAGREAEYQTTDQTMPWPDWLAERTAEDLKKFLAQPEALPFQAIIPADPQLLVPTLAQSVQSFADTPNEPNDAGPVLIWARVSESPFKEAGQQPLFTAVASALAAAQSVAPGTTLQWTAISRFAAESRQRIENEMSGLNLLTLVAVLGVAALAVRRVWKALNLAPVILGALLGAWVVTTMVFSQIHVLVFVIGSLLGGVAVDYGFYLYLQPRKNADESYVARVRRLIKPLLASALTTVLGFSLLFFSDLPLIRQLGVFVSAGLLSALGVALLWFAQVKDPFLETRRFIYLRPRQVTPVLRGIARGLLMLGAVVALAGPWRLQWRDDIRDLDIPAVELKKNDREVRALFGDTAERTIYFSRGDTVAEARAALQRFIDWHQAEFPGAPAASLGLTIPTEAAWRSLDTRLEGLRGYLPALRSALDRHGFNPDSFKSFELAWSKLTASPRAASYDELVQGALGQVAGPMGLLFNTTPGNAWFATLTEDPTGTVPPVSTATVSAGQLQTLNELFSRYRESALRLSALGLGLVGLSVFVIYGLRRGLGIFAVPAGSCLFAFGVLGTLGMTLNLFHLLGAFLGVCLSHNYAIFSAENAANGEAPPPSIRLSALTTATSFGVLALSSIPVVAALGMTVALIVISALLIVELTPLARSPNGA